MAVNRRHEVFPAHARAIIPDGNEGFPAIAQINLDPGGRSIKRVLDQLLKGRSRAFDDLSGGDLVNEIVW